MEECKWPLVLEHKDSFCKAVLVRLLSFLQFTV